MPKIVLIYAVSPNIFGIIEEHVSLLQAECTGNNWPFCALVFFYTFTPVFKGKVGDKKLV